MLRHALQVIDADFRNYRWVLLSPTDDLDRFVVHSAADCDFATYDTALLAGNFALAKADGEAYENESGKPVEDADCAAAVAPLG